MERVADYVINRLVEEGVKTVFLITGRGILYLSDAIAKNEELQSVSVHHEQAAAFAANAYSQYSENLGACIISTGCASTNAITGVLNAWQDGIPVVYISGQNKLRETVGYTGKTVRTYGQQEANVIPLVKPITKYASFVMDPQNIGVEMDKAIYYAKEGFNGPVWLDIPVDVQNMRVEETELDRWSPDVRTKSQERRGKEIDDVTAMIEKAERPVFLIGNGVRAAHAVEDFEELVRKTRIPVVFSNSAVDIYGTANELGIGTVGVLGNNRCANFAIQNSDLVISIGCRLSTITTGSEYEKFARAAKMVVVDIRKEEQDKNTIKIDKLIIDDAKSFIQELLGKELKQTNEAWTDKCKHWKLIFPKCEDIYKHSDKVDIYNLCEVLSRHLEDNAVVLSDAGIEELLVPSTIDFKKGQRMLHPASQGCMGVALPAAMGAYFACGHPVTTINGDGSIMMNLQELQTIAYNKMPIRIVVVNNNVYSVIWKRQKELFRRRTIGTNPEDGVGVPNFQKLAECFDIKYMRIEGTTTLEEGIVRLMKVYGPVICEVMAVEEQDYIRTSAAFNSRRKFVNKPIEDQYPFIDRELFSSEMIIEPIDL